VRLGKRHLVLAMVLGAGAVVLPAVASSETPAVEAVNTGLYSHSWSPAQTLTIAGSTVTIRNSTAVAHGVEWVGGPAKPECSSGVPVGTTPAASGTQWSGTCSFAQPGTYTFYCTVHGPEMTGTITVSANGTTTTTMSTTPTAPTSTAPPVSTPPLPVQAPSGSPLATAPRLRSSQHGGSVTGSLEVSQAGAGDRLEIDLLARGAALGTAKRGKLVRIGRLVRGSVNAGVVPFAVKLDAEARRALAHNRQLVLMVRIALTPANGGPLIVTHTVIERHT
jgi:plastocyanin